MTSPTSTTSTARVVSSGRAPLRVPFCVEPGAARPLNFGVPLSRGSASPAQHWCIVDSEGRVRPSQTRVLASWSDGSVKWLHVVMIARPSTSKSENELRAVHTTERCFVGPQVKAQQTKRQCVTVSSGSSQFNLAAGDSCLLRSASDDSRSWLASQGCRLVFTDANGERRDTRFDALEVIEQGPVRAQVAFRGRIGRGTRLSFCGTASFYAGSGLVKIELTVQNPGRARHRGGYWDLGDPASVLVGGLAWEVASAIRTPRKVQLLECPGGGIRETTGDMEIYQDSSGGVNWDSRNHINRHGAIPQSFRGYRVQLGACEWAGERASPVVCLRTADQFVAATLEDFWQQFPSAIEVQHNTLRVSLWPEQFCDEHELQGGEHNTRVVWLEFGAADGNAHGGLEWVHKRPHAVVDPGWTAGTSAIPFLPSPRDRRRQELETLCRDALEGERSFTAKRETIDEYGWRNYGDVWADHEQVHCDAPPPVISHYNNQYDLLHGLLVEFLCSGDQRWWQVADPLARHLLDIDIYHTENDKPAYSGGLFWHTAHYHDAATCTHRSMSAAMRGKSMPAPGGGPGNEHNYTSGLLLYHYLTGCARAADAVRGLADWVVAMDDGRRHVLGVLSEAPTGQASRTAVAGYHGLGRGAGNSINALLDGWLATGDAQYLSKAIELIRRTVHPDDNIERSDLGNAELRWSYTVHLQALVKFLEVTVDRIGLSEIRRYVQQALLHYARWMVDHERFYLDDPGKLQYPTETWAAQELRKGTTLLMAARYAEPGEHARFRRRGYAILDRAWTSLMSFDSRSYTRPLALVMQQGYLETFLDADFGNPDSAAGDGARGAEFPAAEAFVEQTQCLRQALRSPLDALHIMNSAARPSRWFGAICQTWAAERVRQLVRNGW